MRYGRRRLTKVCGAMNRKGYPCQCKLLLKGGRCKFHGGMSTGPKTAAGMARTLSALLAGKRRWLEKMRRATELESGPDLLRPLAQLR